MRYECLTSIVVIIFGIFALAPFTSEARSAGGGGVGMHAGGSGRMSHAGPGNSSFSHPSQRFDGGRGYRNYRGYDSYGNYGYGYGYPGVVVDEDDDGYVGDEPYDYQNDYYVPEEGEFVGPFAPNPYQPY